jgi:hypothetical protein
LGGGWNLETNVALDFFKSLHVEENVSQPMLANARREGLGIVKEVCDLYILVGAPRIPIGKGNTIFQTFEGGPVFPLEFRRVEEREIDRGLELRREMVVH